MPITKPFDEHRDQYEKWFEENHYAYLSEIEAIKRLLPEDKTGVEIGVGTGRFAEPLGISYGVDPSEKMIEIAGQRGINADKSAGEKLPYKDKTFDFALMVTTICFLDDINKSFAEVNRILKLNGEFIAGFVDKYSHIGRKYKQIQHENEFYKYAKFYSVEDVKKAMFNAGFDDFTYRQTLFRDLPSIKAQEEVRKGYGGGGFVVIKGKKVKHIK
jgi:ubiquinone/menaquinone biosynthesis C-methylase UbiE